MAKEIKQKGYLHFDAPLQREELQRIIFDPEAVAQNKFFPLLGYKKVTYKFSGKLKDRAGKTRERKEREIRYASRRDAAIFQAYRSKLLPLYEEMLQGIGIGDIAIAYRKIPIPERPQAGKCNIHHAQDVFLAIQNTAPCLAIALDIRSFFDNIDHANLYKLWCKLLGVNKLPQDHLAVFKNITNYSVVNLEEALKRVPKPRQGQKQLCPANIFREKIAPLAERHNNHYGIPQGSPISDLLANLSLLHFDAKINLWITSLGGIYRRYSDDIILIIPINDTNDSSTLIETALDFIDEQLKIAGEKLRLKREKTCAGIFLKSDTNVTYVPKEVPGTEYKNKPFEYLGFSFDGKKVLLRNPTVSGFYRKLIWKTLSIIQETVIRFPNKSILEIGDKLDAHVVLSRFLKVEDFAEKSDEYKNWTFWSYAKRAHEVMSNQIGIESGIIYQLKHINKKVQKIININLSRIYAQVKSSKSRKKA